jgi:hypothetical protein
VSFSWRDAPPAKDETRLGFFLGRDALIEDAMLVANDGALDAFGIRRLW